jgi:hypothetical protein
MALKKQKYVEDYRIINVTDNDDLIAQMNELATMDYIEREFLDNGLNHPFRYTVLMSRGQWFDEFP